MLNKSINVSTFLKLMPKIELHAHLFGSITQDQLLNNLKEHGCMTQYEEFKQLKDSLDFNSIFDKAFTYLPSITHSIDDLRAIVRYVLHNFIEDNVVYLELRSSPKKLAGASYEDYFKCLIEEFEAQKNLITTRFIVSINRSVPATEYKELLADIQNVDPDKKYIIGIEYSGDARKNHFNDYRHIFEQARDEGYKITLHTPELETGLSELDCIIDFKPDRLGHFLYYSNEQLERVKELGIPIEICPTSNYVVANRNYHHFVDLLTCGIQKITICTDDILLFRASLSEEWMMFMNQTNYNINQVFQILYQSVDFIFDDKLKDHLRKEIQDFGDKYLENISL